MTHALSDAVIDIFDHLEHCCEVLLISLKTSSHQHYLAWLVWRMGVGGTRQPHFWRTRVFLAIAMSPDTIQRFYASDSRLYASVVCRRQRASYMCSLCTASWQCQTSPMLSLQFQPFYNLFHGLDNPDHPWPHFFLSDSPFWHQHSQFQINLGICRVVMVPYCLLVISPSHSSCGHHLLSFVMSWSSFYVCLYFEKVLFWPYLFLF